MRTLKSKNTTEKIRPLYAPSPQSMTPTYIHQDIYTYTHVNIHTHISKYIHTYMHILREKETQQKDCYIWNFPESEECCPQFLGGSSVSQCFPLRQC